MSILLHFGVTFAAVFVLASLVFVLVRRHRVDRTRAAWLGVVLFAVLIATAVSLLNLGR